MDTILEINAPFYGEVLTLNAPLVFYRMHDSNLTRYDISKARFLRLIKKFDARLIYQSERCHHWGIDFNSQEAIQKALWVFEIRLAASRLYGVGEPSRESSLQILVAALRACARTPFSLRQKWVRGLWLAAVTLSPKAFAQYLVEARFVVARRPKWLEHFWEHRPKTTPPRLNPR